MIGNHPFGTFYPAYTANNSNTAQQIKKYSETVAFRKQAGLKGDGAEGTFASAMKKADEFQNSGEYCGATDSIGIILRQMKEPEPGGKVDKVVFHEGVCVQITKDYRTGTSITIGGSNNPEWIHVKTSVGTVNIDMNDLDSLMKCLDMFSPEDLNAILREITKVRQARDAGQEIENTEDEVIKQADGTKEDREKED